MKIKNAFLKGLETIFTVMEEAVHTGIYTVEVDDGFVDEPVLLTDSVRCIFTSFNAKEDKDVSFYELIQAKDIKGIMPFNDLVNCEITTQAYIMFDTDKYMVEAYDVDPLEVSATLLLRRV